MNKKQKIKVIKRSEAIVANSSLIKEEISEKMTNRETSSTVAEWVKEFEKRLYEETTFIIRTTPCEDIRSGVTISRMAKSCHHPRSGFRYKNTPLYESTGYR